MLEWKAEAALDKNTYQGRKRCLFKLRGAAGKELRGGAVLAVHLAMDGTNMGVVWRSAYLPDEIGTVKMPKWDHFSGTYRCGNITVV